MALRIVTAPEHEGYQAALEEIYRLRSLLAFEAAVLEAHSAAIPVPLARSITRMRDAARGRFDRIEISLSHPRVRAAREKARMAHTLTRDAWETNRGVQR